MLHHSVLEFLRLVQLGLGFRVYLDPKVQRTYPSEDL